MTSSSSPLATRRVIAAAALTSVAALVTACGTSSPSAAPAKTAASTAAASPPAAASTAAATSAQGTPAAAPAGIAPCPTRSLGAKVGVSQGTAGSTYVVLDFTNISNVTCTLYGYPGVSLAGGTPVTQIGAAAAESHATARVLVTLAPGGIANAVLQIVHAGNYPASRCGPATATSLQIYPPNQTTPIYLSYSSPACSKPVQILTVSVVRAGAGSS
jgi:Protein of unknown function (DUF4232)